MDETMKQAGIEWKQTFDALPDLVAIIDREHRLVRINQAMAKKLGVRPEDAIGKHCYRMIHGTDRPLPFCPHSKLLSDGQEHTAENFEKKLGGHYLATASPLCDAGGRLIGCVHVWRDITERKRMESALLDREERYRLLYGGITDAVFVHAMTADDPRGRFLEVNDVACRRLGYTREELLTMSPLDIDATESGIDMKSIMEKLLKGEAAFFEQVHIAKDCRHIPVEINARMFMLQGQRAIISLVRDITERKKADDAVRKSEEKLRNLLEHLPVGIGVANDNDRVVLHNKRYYELFGYSKGDIPNLAEWWSRAYPDEAYRKWVMKTWDHDVRRSREENVPIESRLYRVTCKDGQVKDIEISGLTIDNELVATFIDQTERKKAEEALRRAHDELEDKVRERTKDLEKLNEELEIKSQSLEELNTTLKVLLAQREKDKYDLEDRILSNVQSLLVPTLEKLNRHTRDPKCKSYIDLLESNLLQIVSSFSKRLSSAYLNLTQTEIEVANLIKAGKTTKEIAELLNISKSTVDSHRQNIRKRLKLNNKKTNLRSYLLSLQ